MWINADNKQMDNWLKLMGKPMTGSVMSDTTPQLTQLLVMGLGLFAQPLNVHTLVGWLQMPVHPLDGFFRSRLVNAIVAEGVYRNEACQKLVEESMQKEKRNFSRCFCRHLQLHQSFIQPMYVFSSRSFLYGLSNVLTGWQAKERTGHGWSS